MKNDSNKFENAAPKRIDLKLYAKNDGRGWAKVHRTPCQIYTHINVMNNQNRRCIDAHAHIIMTDIMALLDSYLWCRIEDVISIAIEVVPRAERLTLKEQHTVGKSLTGAHFQFESEVLSNCENFAAVKLICFVYNVVVSLI